MLSLKRTALPGLTLLCLALELEGVKLCLRHGNSPEAPYFYAGMGLVHAVFRAEFAQAAEYGRLAVALQRPGRPAPFTGAADQGSQPAFRPAWWVLIDVGVSGNFPAVVEDGQS